ncbi:ribosomal protein S18 acetylase RimI-like enzyme [Planomicrobium sp. HSC-17F08]|nr:ribosomal protein S18 acetylase RimI-like enzyme [Planomicrobium sp. HSC-17F08]
MIIRKAFIHEYDAIKKQRLASYEPFSQIIPAGHWEILKNTLTSENVKNSGAEVFVAEIDGTIAGSIVLFPSQSQAYEWDTAALEFPEIRMLAVDANFRSNGIGKALVEHCIAAAKVQGYPFIGLHTAHFMESAIRLYKQIGFSRVPSLDFEPLDDGIIVKAFRLNLMH